MSGTPFAAVDLVRDLIGPLVPAGVTVIWAKQNAGRPNKPYLALRIMSRRTDQNEEYGAVADDGTQSVLSNVYMMLEIQAYGDGAQDLLDGLRDRLTFQTTVMTCTMLGISVRGTGTVTNISALLDAASFEDRASLEIEIGYRASATDTVGIIESVSGTGTALAGSVSETVIITAP